MKLKEPRSFSSSFIFFFSLFSLFFLSFCSLEPLATQCTYSTSPPPCLNVCLSSSNEVMIAWWSECTKTFINSLDSTLEFKGASPRERLKPTEEEKGQAGRPRGVEPAGLLPVGLHFFGFFFCELFDAFQAYVLLNFALDSTVLPSK